MGIGYASGSYYLTWNSKFTATHLEIDSINVRGYENENNFPTRLVQVRIGLLTKLVN